MKKIRSEWSCKFYFVTLLCIIVSACRHHPLPPDNAWKCIPVPSGVGIEYASDTLNFTSPDYNPTNPEEISYVVVNSQTFYSELFVFNNTTKSQRAIASKIYYCPKWNLNGVIVYNGTDNNIRTVDASNLKITLLTTSGNCYNPDWSPDGRFIVYENGNNVGIINSNGTGSRLLFDSANFRYPAWSPDGNKIAFLKTVEDSVASIVTALIVYDTTLRTFTTLGRSKKIGKHGIDWFANSNDIVWATPDGMYLSSLSGTQKLLKEGCNSRSYLYPSISSDGKSILVCRIDSRLIDENTIHDATNLYTMNADGSNEKKVEF